MSKTRSLETLTVVQKLNQRHAREIRKMENAARGLERERERGSYATKDDIAALVSQFDAKLNALSSNAWTRTLAVASIVATVAIGVFLTVHAH